MKLIMENWRKFQEQEEEAAETPETPRIKDYDLTPEQIKKLISIIQSVYNERYGTVNERDENPLVISKRASSTAGLDSSSEMGKVYDRIEDVTRNIGRQVAPSTLETVKSAFPNSEMDSRGHLVIADKYVVSDENNLSDKAVNITNTNFFLDTVDNVHGKQLDLALENMNQQEVLKLISEEVDRLIQEGLLEEDFKRNMMKFLMGTTLFAGALGGMPGKAQAEMNPEEATVAVTQAIKKELKKQGMTMSGTDYDTGKPYEISLDGQKDDLEKLGKAVSNLTIAKGTDKAGDARTAKYFAKQIIKLAPKNIDGKIKGKDARVPNGNSIGHAADALSDVAQAVANKTNKENFKNQRATQANMVNYDLAVANAFNGMQFASTTDDSAKIKEAVDHLFDVLESAEKQGALDGKAGQALKLLGKGDTEGFKKLMGY